MKRIRSNWRKEIVKAVGGNSGEASDAVFAEFTSSWLVGSKIGIVTPSKMCQFHLELAPQRVLRRFVAEKLLVRIL